MSGEFIGQEAVITLGVASRAHPAQARVLSEAGEEAEGRFVTVMPARKADRFYKGDRVLLTGFEKGVYLATPKP